MPGPIVYLDRSDIHPGNLAELKESVAGLVAFIEQREPQLVVYSFHIDEEASTLTVVAVHPNVASLERHLQVGGPEFRKVAPMITLHDIEVFGDPGPAVPLLAEKARMLGGARVAIHPITVGFARMGAQSATGRSSSS